MALEDTTTAPAPAAPAPGAPQGMHTTHERVEAMLAEGLPDDDPNMPSPPPTETPPPEPTPEPAPEPETSSEPETYEVDIGGQTYRVTKDEHQYLMRLGLERHAEDLERRRQPQARVEEPKPAPATPQPGQAPVSPELAAIRKELEDLKGWKTETEKAREAELQKAEAAAMVRGAEKAMAENEFFKEHANDPETYGWLKTQVLILQHQKPDMSYANAAKIVANMNQKISGKEKERYVKEKVKAANQTVETGGQTQGPQTYKPTRHSLFDGTSLARAMAMLKAGSRD